MVTYQDLLAVGQERQIKFIRGAISKYKSTEMYKTAQIADEYARRKNRTINRYQKLLYTVSGKAVPDNFSANYKMGANFFDQFVTQLNQYLLGNGATFQDSKTKERLGEDFDEKLQEAGRKAQIHGASFGFWNLDHLEIFSALEFCPLYDEVDGALKAGIRWWQIDSSKPLRATLYELDGYTEYIWESGSAGRVLYEKRPYILFVTVSEADGQRIYGGENYPSFPIVPLYANEYKQSELVGIREQIDAYDLIKSGFANDLDDASQIYWTLQNAGGMDDVDLAQFIQHMKTVKAAVLDDQAQAQAHTLEVPYASREALLERLERDLYKNAMVIDIYHIASGATTATQIKAAYEPMNNKADQFEYCVIKFVRAILALAGIQDKPTFTRSKVVNASEEIQTVVTAANHLDKGYVTTKILNILGDGDKAEEMVAAMEAANNAPVEQERDDIH